MVHLVFVSPNVRKVTLKYFSHQLIVLLVIKWILFADVVISLCIHKTSVALYCYKILGPPQSQVFLCAPGKPALETD